jgi:hypothetical protein
MHNGVASRTQQAADGEPAERMVVVKEQANTTATHWFSTDLAASTRARQQQLVLLARDVVRPVRAARISAVRLACSLGGFGAVTGNVPP